jgi:hypothetical protein
MRQWVDADRTVLVRQFDDGTIEVATRPEAGAVWGPPTCVEPDEWTAADVQRVLDERA